jgi:transposase
MLRFIGVDVHRRLCEIAIVDGQGRVLLRFSVPCTRAALEEWAREYLLPTDELALEATANSWAVARVLRPFVARLVVSNPLTTKAIASAKIKTDKVDALALAQLLRCRYLPEVWQPDEETERRRTVTHRRATLVSERTRLKNRIHSVLAQHLIPLPEGGLFTGKGLQWLAQQALPELGQSQIDSDLRLLAACEGELQRLETELVREAHAEPRVKLLMTLPGVDYTVALALLAALGDHHRFPDGDRAAAYLGLVPSTRQSGDRCYHGPITRHGNGRTRWLVIQAAQHLGTHPGPLGVFFRRLLKKKNRNVAVVATARKLVVIAWQMLKENEPYRYAQPGSTKTKLARLRVKATGKSRRGGTAKGAPRSANYGTGQGSRRTPSLPEVLVSEDLPPARGPESVPPGERRVLEEAGVTEFVAHIQEPHRRLRSTGTKAGC